jgi:AcrR family transcriptional regulator
VLDAAWALVRDPGFAATSLEDIAARAGLSPESVRARYPDKRHIVAALLRAYSPIPALRDSLAAVEGEDAAGLLRDAMRRLISVVREHEAYFELAFFDAQVNGDGSLSQLGADIVGPAGVLLDRLKATGQLRPISDAILGRMLAAFLIGFLASERIAPGAARFAMRLFPQRVWLDGMVDLLLYGVLEDNAR